MEFQGGERLGTSGSTYPRIIQFRGRNRRGVEQIGRTMKILGETLYDLLPSVRQCLGVLLVAFFISVCVIANHGGSRVAHKTEIKLPKSGLVIEHVGNSETGP